MERKLTQHTIDTPYLVGPVHCYTLEHDGNLYLFDTGPPTREAKTYFRNTLSLDRLKHIFISHCHVDHYGLAHWFERNTCATIYLPYRDHLKLIHHQQRMNGMYELLFSLGFDRKYLEALKATFDSGVLHPPPPSNYLVAEDGLPDDLGLRLLNCPGHSQSDLVYLFDQYAVTGDTLLKGIFQSPLLDIDLRTGKRFNNYRAYCETIVKLSGLQNMTVLPGHRKRVEVPREIILSYITKLLQRAIMLRPYAQERNIPAVIEALFQDAMKNIFHVYLKASEILFMQDFLVDPQRLALSLHDIGLYESVSGLFEQATAQ